MPGSAGVCWNRELREDGLKVKNWAYLLNDGDQNPDMSFLSDIEKEMENQTPQRKEVTSTKIERGPYGEKAKKINNYQCQLCEAMGMDPISFMSTKGVPYVEAHHVVPVSQGEAGSLAFANIMTLCANHHRQMHYSDVEVTSNDSHFFVKIDGDIYELSKLSIN